MDIVSLDSLIIHTLLLGVCCSIVAHAFLDIITAPSMIFESYKPFVQRLIWGKGHHRLGGKHTHILVKIDKVLTQCSICISGQLALFSSLIIFKNVVLTVLCISVAVIATTHLVKWQQN